MAIINETRVGTMQTNLMCGTRQVVIWNQGGGVVEARLYVNSGETATLTAWKGRTEKGARRWAAKVMGA